MGLGFCIKNLDIMGVYWKIQFLECGSRTKTKYRKRGGGCLKPGASTVRIFKRGLGKIERLVLFTGGLIQQCTLWVLLYLRDTSNCHLTMILRGLTSLKVLSFIKTFLDWINFTTFLYYIATEFQVIYKTGKLFIIKSNHIVPKWSLWIASICSGSVWEN